MADSPGIIFRAKDALRNTFQRFKSARARRRKAFSQFISKWLFSLRVVLFLVGYSWFFFLPSPRLGRGTYIDENALQPSQVSTYWNWADVHRADKYLSFLENLRDRNVSSEERASQITEEFRKLGIHSATHTYKFSTPGEPLHGVNAYAIISSPRSSVSEAMVISAPWISRSGPDTLNLRGVATVLSLAAFLKQYSFWARDIILVISDGQFEGMHAWLSSYHGEQQSNLETDIMHLKSGVIWTALNIDYPGHSFSHLGAFYEGLNGRLPNQDLYNSFQLISRHTGGVPVVLYDHIDPREVQGKSALPQWLPSSIRQIPEVAEYAVRARNVFRHMRYQAYGVGSGSHASFHRFRIDAFTIFAVPAPGPHGFHSIGRVIESTLRTMSNLLERLHASFFFYVLTTPSSFLKIGHYLPSVILISVSIMFGGLREWVNAGWVKAVAGSETSLKKISNGVEDWRRPSRDVLDAALIMFSTHITGTVIFGWKIYGHHLYSLYPSETAQTISSSLPVIVAALFVYVTVSGRTSSRLTHRNSIAPASMVIKSLNLCLASTLISITSVLNFSLAAALAIALGLPLSVAPSHGSRKLKIIMATLFFTYFCVTLQLLVTRNSLQNWTILNVWFAPLMCIVYLPLLLQATIVCILS